VKTEEKRIIHPEKSKSARFDEKLNEKICEIKPI